MLDKWGNGRFDNGPFREDLLASWINKYKFKRVAELGVLDGNTASTIIENCPDLEHYVGIDMWEKPHKYPPGTYLGPIGDQSRKVYEELNLNDLYLLTLNKINKVLIGEKPKVTLIKKPTSIACAMFEDDYFDLIFIDADHSYEGVKRDILDWKNKVRSGGMLCGHDFSWPGILKAITETIGIDKIVNFTDDVWVHYKL